MKRFLWLFLIIVIIILLILLWLCHAGKLPFCKSNPPSINSYYCDTCYKDVHGDTTQQIIVWREPKSDDLYAREWLDSIHRKCGDFKITLFCSTCDSSLMLLTGPGIKTFLTGNGGTKGGGTTCTKNCPLSGDSLFWCVDYPLNYGNNVGKGGFTDFYIDTANQDTTRKKSLSVPPAPAIGGFLDTAIIVAVFDSGIDPWDISQYLYNTTDASCLNVNANNGWNFPNKNNIVNDNYEPPIGHGEMVSRLIVDQVTHYKLNSIKILPVKTHDEYGRGDLFSILCGFAYAKERGAKIINASFGYYAPKTSGALSTTDPNTLLLKTYIKYYLTKNNILLIAAAGNKKEEDNGNLDDINFYPASLAADPDLPNVIAVTTVNISAGKISPTENYSGNVVDIGINANKQHKPESQINDDYYFINPKYPFLYERGSSYATPVLTGIICSHYDMIKTAMASGNFNKPDMFRVLFQPALGVGNTNNLSNKLKFGVMWDNSKPVMR